MDLTPWVDARFIPAIDRSDFTQDGTSRADGAGEDRVDSPPRGPSSPIQPGASHRSALGRLRAVRGTLGRLWFGDDEVECPGKVFPGSRCIQELYITSLLTGVCVYS